MSFKAPVAHPRLWLALALTSCGILTGIMMWGEFFSPPEGRGLSLIVLLSVGTPLLLLFAWSLAVWRRSYDRAKRISRGHCAYCDYNLNGNTSGICPECGTPVPPGK